MRPDIRAAWLARLATAPCSRIVALLWPRLLPLHPLEEEPPPVGRAVELPQPVGSLSARVLDQKGIYLLENGTSAVVHFGPDAPSHQIMQLLGVPSLNLFVQVLVLDPDACSSQIRVIKVLLFQTPGTSHAA